MIDLFTEASAVSLLFYMENKDTGENIKTLYSKSTVVHWGYTKTSLRPSAPKEAEKSAPKEHLDEHHPLFLVPSVVTPQHHSSSYIARVLHSIALMGSKTLSQCAFNSFDNFQELIQKECWHCWIGTLSINQFLLAFSKTRRVSQ